MKWEKDENMVEVPKGEMYEPGEQINKAKKGGKATPKKIIDNIIG